MDIHFEGPESVLANQLFWATLVVHFDEEVLSGGRIAIAVRHVTDFGAPQILDPDCENYVAVVFSRPDIGWAFDPELKWYRHPWNLGFELVITSGQVAPGDNLTITLGGNAGYRSQSFVEDKFRFRVGIQPAPDARWTVMPVEDSPGFPVVGNVPVAIEAFVPQMNGLQPAGRLDLVIQDAYGNPAVLAEPLRLRVLLDDSRPLAERTVTESLVEISGLALPCDGKWHRLSVVTADGRLAAHSNPFGPSLVPGYQLLFGDLHNQSGLCDGTGTPDYLYEYARKGAGLDFVAITSHDNEITPTDWETVKEATRAAHAPGEFVTFLGYEWTAWSRLGGDHNIIYPGDDGPLIYSNPYLTPVEWLPSTGFIDRERTITQVIEELGDRAALIIPHNGGNACDLDFFDAARMPAWEVHSCHRNWEDVVEQVHRRGIRCAFVGGSDDHRGLAGNSIPAFREPWMSAHNGIMGVWAKELTRESIWEAILAKRVYATNGCRAALTFVANGAFMGQELRVAPGAELRFSFDLVVDGWFDHAELVRYPDVIARFAPDWNQIRTFHGEHVAKAERGSAMFYLRVVQNDGGRAWSSAIWIDVQ